MPSIVYTGKLFKLFDFGQIIFCDFYWTDTVNHGQTVTFVNTGCCEAPSGTFLPDIPAMIYLSQVDYVKLSLDLVTPNTQTEGTIEAEPPPSGKVVGFASEAKPFKLPPVTISKIRKGTAIFKQGPRRLDDHIIDGAMRFLGDSGAHIGVTVINARNEHVDGCGHYDEEEGHLFLRLQKERFNELESLLIHDDDLAEVSISLGTNFLVDFSAKPWSDSV